MEKSKLKVVSGILLIITAIFLGKTSVYTSIKGFVLDHGGSIGLAVAVGMGLTIVAFASGAVILRRA